MDKEEQKAIKEIEEDVERRMKEDGFYAVETITITKEEDGWCIQKKGCSFIGTIDKLTDRELRDLCVKIYKIIKD